MSPERGPWPGTVSVSLICQGAGPCSAVLGSEMLAIRRRNGATEKALSGRVGRPPTPGLRAVSPGPPYCLMARPRPNFTRPRQNSVVPRPTLWNNPTRRCEGGARVMPINRLLEGRTLGPEEVRRLNAAYERALRELSLVDRNDALTEIVAKKVVEIGLDGARDPKDIAKAVVKAIGLTAPR